MQDCSDRFSDGLFLGTWNYLRCRDGSRYAGVWGCRVGNALVDFADAADGGRSGDGIVFADDRCLDDLPRLA